MEKKKPSLKEYMLQQLRAINMVSEFVSDDGMAALEAFCIEGETAPKILREAVRCLIDHVPAEQIKQLLADGAPLSDFQEARRKHWINLCALNDDLADQVQRKIAEATAAIEESGSARDALLNRLDESLSWAKEQAEKLQQVQQEQIQALQQDLTEEKKKASALNEQLLRLQAKLSRMAESAGSEHKQPEMPEGGGRAFWGRRKLGRKDREAQLLAAATTEAQKEDITQFKEKILQGGNYSEEQITYLLACLREGLTTAQILKFAGPNFTVDVMQELRKTWEERGVL